MKGLIEEASEWIGEDAQAEVMEAGIIAAAQRVEHYEIAGYGTVQTFAKLLAEKEAAELFTLTLNEEKAADKKLSLLAKSINVKAKTEKATCERQNSRQRIGGASCQDPSWRAA
jgi:ferritin-like metal-binding protein YciE